ncbi:MAG: pitrilysin family protein [Acidobacteria bacterium]|nr:pitrilysin family protein [Acidobacteriota bacterium]
MQIAYEKQTLDNRLDVIVHEDHGCPIVAVNLWYHVGSKNERPGRTGFAHLFEHLMFEGSAHFDRGYFYPLQEVGGTLNGSTSTDRTNYWEVVPTGAFERALWMESDRMGYLLPALTQEKFETQREVVLNERRQNYENRPYGLVPMALMAALHPPDHPYHWLTIGEPDDLRAAGLADVKAFFATYYHPGNASLAIAGDVRAADAFGEARRHFEEIPGGPPPPPPAVPAEADSDGERRLLLVDRVELPRLYLAWRTPPLFAADDAELDLLAELLTGGKASRLYRRLVREQRIATDVSAAQGSRELASSFFIAATAAPGHDLAELEAVIADELDALRTDPPGDDEVERARTTADADFVYRTQTVGGFGGRSDQLNLYNVLTGDPGYGPSDRARYAAARPQALRRAADLHLRAERRVAVSVVPAGETAAALPDSVLVSPR